ncbi:hypothetical protein [Dactylosporangium sp. CS-033363]|uniref:hypothetical protein n=1 Tax=Dactylosporangium sp. CS-033363 TaxID=3239935 RepID=UPI003D91B145
MGRPPRSAVLLLAAGALLAGCGAAGPARDSHPAPAGGAPGAPAGVTADLDTQTWDLLAQVRAAKGRAVVACMERQGFHVHPNGDSDTPKDPPGEQYPFRAPLTLEQARTGGYPGIGETAAEPEPSRSAADDPFARLPIEAQHRYLDALGKPATYTLPDGTVVGLTRGGCDEQVMRKLYPDLDAYLLVESVTQNAPNVVRDETLQDERVAGALRGWSACMREHGYPDLATFDDADVAATRYYWPRGGPSPTREQARAKEIDQAVADAGCAEQSHADGVLHAAWTDTRQRYQRSHERDFVTLRELLESALRAAQTLVGNG